jgi:hypothetical protein
MANQIPEPTKTEQKPSPEQSVSTPGEASFKFDKDYHGLSDFLGLSQEDRLNEEVAQKVSFIRDFVDEVDELDATIKIRDLIRSLGVPEKGKTLVKTLYEYTRLESQKDTIEKKQSLLIAKPHVIPTHREYSTVN